jgi:hypothetical protein
MATEKEETPLQSSISSFSEPSVRPAKHWAKWGILAAVSVAAGGLAAAWWYKKAVKSLHQAEENAKYPEF